MARRLLNLVQFIISIVQIKRGGVYPTNPSEALHMALCLYPKAKNFGPLGINSFTVAMNIYRINALIQYSIDHFELLHYNTSFLRQATENYSCFLRQEKSPVVGTPGKLFTLKRA